MYDSASERENEYLETYFIITWLFLIIRKVSCIISMILLIYFLLIHVILIAGLKMTDKKEKSIHLSDMPPLESDEEVK